MPGQTLQIDTAQIPEHIRLDLLSIIHDATVEFFQQPGVAEKYERWKAEKEKGRTKPPEKGVD